MTRLYYCSLSFADDGGRVQSTTMKTPTKVITDKMLREGQMALGMSENAALLAACWLGKMTDKEYAEGVKPISKVRIAKYATYALTPFLIVALAAVLARFF
ncbi:hypothetical protein KGP24_24040 (plasmid) [Enterobacter sp. JBIWA008]|uniref:hypothetical protein n=1 Tax=Enterobacteriaceae TaxID=543 RepID=UPI000F841380|nr:MULTISPECIES: hypothetical protein [Enterobacteriaceae]HDT6029036.1 hypothetical protein [Enterobacter cloacae subsp. cloacae]HEW9972629.1 hypothetical protein [Enterobacter cloacae]EKS6506885.1 hypothetical protein [Enterobacter hormaechei]ELE6478012.1 hypothetical protein [Enterobacter hormaechei]ELT6450945.1 hypothetical protein [Enterobacter hormaechei]